jgi:NAD(P)-dependent dehydrogenase (short-subunit alcohol dehydrogenase family)
MSLNDLTDHVCVVTGANSGIGKATAKGLADLGARVVMVCRSLERGREARSDLQEDVSNASLDLMEADLAVQEETHDLAGRLLNRYDRLDVLVNNAGLYRPSREETPDGIEMTFAVNYLAPFLLTHLVLDRMKATAEAHGEARIVNMGSDAHRGADVDFEDLQGSDSYGGIQAYGQSKLAMVMFTHELARRLRGSGVTVNCVHPGVVATNMWRGADWISRMGRLFTPLFKSPEEGAKGPLYVAASPEVEGVTGQYFDGTERTKPSPSAFDEKVAARLWRLSMELTGLDESDGTEEAEGL